MKNKKLVIGLVGIFLLVFFSNIINPNISIPDNPPILSQEEILDELIPVDFPIYINNRSDWSYYIDNYDWCFGNGTEVDPYIIEGIHVTNENQTAYISIENVEHFIIRNCKVSNYVAKYGHWTFAGIYIGNGQFGLIDNCTIINCTMGISLANGINWDYTEITKTIKITNCKFIGSHYAEGTGKGSAITLHGVIFGAYDGVDQVITNIRNINISYNDIYNYASGITVRNAEEIYIDNNRIETTYGYVVETGIYFYTVNDSTITNNDLYGCELGGHNYEEPKTSSDGFSITLENCHNITIYGNRFYDKDGNLIGDFNSLIDWQLVIGAILVIGVIGIGVSMIYRRRKGKDIE